VRVMVASFNSKKGNILRERRSGRIVEVENVQANIGTHEKGG